MEEEKTLTGGESLRLIRQMIDIAKQEQRDDGKGWILWGWLLFAASVFSFLNNHLEWVSPYFFWNAFGIITICFCLYATMRYFSSKPVEVARTYTGDLLRKINIGFFIAIAFIIVATNNGSVSPMAGFPLLVNIYGFRLLIHGAALNFKPFLIGACIAWFFGLLGLFARTFDWVMLTHAAAVLCGYIIPGYMANSEFKKTKPTAFNNDIVGV